MVKDSVKFLVDTMLKHDSNDTSKTESKEEIENTVKLSEKATETDANPNFCLC